MGLTNLDEELCCPLMAGHAGARRRGVCLLVLCIFWAIASVGGSAEVQKRDMGATLLEAEEKLEDLKKQLVDREKLVDMIMARSCKDEVCRASKLNLARRARQRQANKQVETMEQQPWEQFRVEAQLDAPLGVKLSFVRFLPISNSNNTNLMNRFLIATDQRGNIHIFNSGGDHVKEHHTGHSAAITALSVDFRPSTDFKIVTGSVDGEIRTFSIPAPHRPRRGSSPRTGTPGQGNKTMNESARNDPASSMDARHVWAAWDIKIILESAFYPAQSEPIKGLSRRHHMLDLTQQGKLPISMVEFAVKGRSYNIVAVDSAGRLSTHMRNGTLTGSVMLPGKGAPKCSYMWKSVAAFCTDAGMAFYETKERRLLTSTCTRIILGDEGLPEAPPVLLPRSNKNKTNGTNATMLESQPRKRTRFPPEPVVAPFISYGHDPVMDSSVAYAGTSDGRLFMLQVRGDKSRVRCSVSNEINVTTDNAAHVYVAATKGYVYAAIASKSRITVNAYNSSTASRTHPPEISLQVSIQNPWGKTVACNSDRHAGLALLIGDAALLFSAKLEYIKPSGWSQSNYNMLRHPLLLGGVGLMFMWQMKKKSSSAGTSDGMEEALKEDWAAKIGRAKDPFQERFQRGGISDSVAGRFGSGGAFGSTAATGYSGGGGSSRGGTAGRFGGGGAAGGW